MDTLVVIYCDNISSILFLNNLVYHVRKKHIEVYYHFVRKIILIGKLNLFMLVLRIRLLTFSQKL